MEELCLCREETNLQRLDVSYNDIREETVDRIAKHGVLWVQSGAFEPATLRESNTVAMCDAKEYFFRRGPLESGVRKKMAEEARIASKSTRAGGFPVQSSSSSSSLSFLSSSSS